MKKILFGLILGAALLQVARSATVTLGWDAVPSPNTSYKLYYGGATGNYTNFVNTVNTQAQVLGLVRGNTYFFSVTACQTNIIGTNKVVQESPFSAEVTYLPALPPVAPSNLRLVSE